ncbi:MAG: hypothetical protein OXF93_18000 [Acidobacteria bacterium]|nr:hypothetical protein [Acidobacteriota bacterium]
MHRFKETIDGRPISIEVTPVQGDRWRAYLVREPGGPTALMPFYGSTPQEAARQLRNWLALVHRDETDSV